MRAATDAHGRCLVGVAAVADGMGGGAFGERASSFCIDRILDDSARDLRLLGGALASPAAWVTACRDWLLRLNQDVINLGKQLTAPNDVGSTLTAVLFTGRRAFLMHAGDSRLYLLRSGGVSLLTRSQTYAEQLHEEGQLTREEVDASIYRNVLTSYIGSAKCAPQVEELHLVPGDTLILCSDGLIEGLTDGEMHDLAAKLSPNEAVVEMVRRCKRNLQTAPSDPTAAPGIACSDNMTAVVVQIPDEPTAEQTSRAARAEAVLSEKSASASLGASSTPPAEGEQNA
jgi:protein phosphatase